MIRYGIAGAGSIAHKFAREIKAVDEASLEAIASRSLSRANAFKETHQLKHAFAGYEAMAKSNAIDVVYIATPHASHAALIELFMTHKKHVICEKPITVTAKELAHLMDLQKEYKVALMEAMWTRFLPVTKDFITRFKANEFGAFKSGHIEFGYALIDDYDPKRRLLNPTLAGGSLLDIGVYPIHFALNVLDLKQLRWEANATMTTTGVDATCEMLGYNTNNEVTLSLLSSIDKNATQEAKFVFENATVVLPDFSRAHYYMINDEKITLPYKEEGFVHEIEAFNTLVKNNLLEHPLLPLKQSLDAMHFMDHIRMMIGLEYPNEA